MNHEDWCELLSTKKVKDNRKRAVNQIKRIATSRSASHSDRDESIRVPLKKRDRTGVIKNYKQKGKDTPNHHIAQRYCVLCKKAGLTEQKYMSHISDECFGNVSDQNSIKYRLLGYLVIR